MSADIDTASTVFVTGAAGWLGLGLTNALAHGLDDVPLLNQAQHIRCLVAEGQNTAHLRSIAPQIEITEGDITKPESMRTFFAHAEGGILYHCAGVIHPERVADFERINTQGAIDVWECAAKAGIKRIVVMSSNSPCGCNPHPDHLFTETSPYRPYMGYGRSKMLMEQGIIARAAKGGPETVIIRAPWFYGPFQPPRQTEFFVMVRNGRGPLVGSGHNRRSMTYIDNLAQGMILAGTMPQAAGQTYWIADSRPYSMREILDTIETVMQRDFNITCKGGRLRLPSFVSDIASAVDCCLQKADLYHQKIHVLSEMNKTIACSIDKARAELGYEPKIALEEGMKRSLAWLMKQDSERRKLLHS
jgi:nucleoside-diphosphate-sugar epimerase